MTIKCAVRVLSLTGAQGGFAGDPTSLARDNIFFSGTPSSMFLSHVTPVSYFHVLFPPHARVSNGISLTKEQMGHND